MTRLYQGPPGVGIDLEQTDTVPAYEIGTILPAANGWFQYVQVTEDVSAGELVQIEPVPEAGALNIDPVTFEGELATTTTAGSVAQDAGIALVDIAADSWGWLFRGFGVALALIANGVPATSQLTTTGTGGTVGTGGVGIDGLTSLEEGVTATLKKVKAAGLITIGKAAAAD